MSESLDYWESYLRSFHGRKEAFIIQKIIQKMSARVEVDEKSSWIPEAGLISEAEL